MQILRLNIFLAAKGGWIVTTSESTFDEKQKHEISTFLIFKSFFKGDFDDVKKHFFYLKEVGAENQSIKLLLEIFENNSLEDIKIKLIDFEKTEKDGNTRKLFLRETLAIAKGFDTFIRYSDKIKIIEDTQLFEIQTE